MSVVCRVVSAVVMLLVSVNSYGNETDISTTSSIEATYVGSEACIECHQKEVEQWKGSDHERAMDHATAHSVLGDFDNATFEFKGKENRFFKKGSSTGSTLKDQMASSTIIKLPTRLVTTHFNSTWLNLTMDVSS